MSNEIQHDGTETFIPGKSWRVLARDGDASVELENRGVIDELVVDDWLHLEQMHSHQWWMRVGDARVWINVEGSNKVRVDIERGFYQEISGETTAVTDPSAASE